MLRQIAAQGVLGLVAVSAACWWLSEDEPDPPGPEEEGGLVRREADERAVVVGVSSLSSMVRVDQTDADAECRLMSVGERLQTLDAGARVTPAPAARTGEDAAAPSSVTRKVADRSRESRRIAPVPDEFPERDASPAPQVEAEARRARPAEGGATAFVPQEPAELAAERTRWHPELKGLGVSTWSYRAVRIAERLYRVDAFFSFADGRTFIYSTTTCGGYPAAPVLVRGWLANNPSKEV